MLISTSAPLLLIYGHKGALRGNPGSAWPKPEPNATELPSSAPDRPSEVYKASGLRAFALRPHRNAPRNMERFATTPGCGCGRADRPPRLRPRRETHRHDAELQASRPSAFTHADACRAPRWAAYRASPRPRPPPRAEKTPHVSGLQTLPRFAPPPSRGVRKNTSLRRRAADLAPPTPKRAEDVSKTATGPACLVAPYRSVSCTKTAAAAVVARRGRRAPPGPRSPSPAPRSVTRPPQRPPQLRRVLGVLVLHVSPRKSAGGGGT